MEIIKTIKRSIHNIGIHGTAIRVVGRMAGHLSEDEQVFRYYKKKYGKIVQGDDYRKWLEHFDTKKDSGDKSTVQAEEKEKIYVCWLQGMEQAPELVQACYRSLKKYAGGHEVVTLSLDNYRDYVTLPDWIEEKYAKGHIVHANFSDILRSELLRQNGGLWVDATMLLTEQIPEWIFDTELFAFQFPLHPGTRQVASSQFLHAKPHNEIFERTLSGMYAMHKREKKALSYYNFHYMLALASQGSREARAMWAAIEPLEAGINHLLQKRLFEPYSEAYMEYLKKLTFVHKLSYHIVNEQNAAVKGTYYDVLIHQALRG